MTEAETSAICDLAERYLDEHRNLPESVAAFGEVCDLVLKQPTEAWVLVQHLIHKAKDEVELAFVAAGPVEDFLKKHGGPFRVEIVTAARRGVKVGQALRGVWGRRSIDARLLAELDAIGAGPER